MFFISGMCQYIAHSFSTGMGGEGRHSLKGNGFRSFPIKMLVIL